MYVRYRVIYFTSHICTFQKPPTFTYKAIYHNVICPCITFIRHLYVSDHIRITVLYSITTLRRAPPIKEAYCYVTGAPRATITCNSVRPVCLLTLHVPNSITVFDAQRTSHLLRFVAVTVGNSQSTCMSYTHSLILYTTTLYFYPISD